MTDHKTIDVTVRSIKRTETEKKDVEVDREKVVLRDAEGQYSVTIEGPRGTCAGLKAEAPIQIVLKRVQRTIQEATLESRKSEPDAHGEEKKPSRVPIKVVRKKK